MASLCALLRTADVFVLCMCTHGVQIKALEQHKSQYDNATAVAESVYSLGALVSHNAQQQSGYVEGFLYVPQMA